MHTLSEKKRCTQRQTHIHTYIQTKKKKLCVSTYDHNRAITLCVCCFYVNVFLSVRGNDNKEPFLNKENWQIIIRNSWMGQILGKRSHSPNAICLFFSISLYSLYSAQSILLPLLLSRWFIIENFFVWCFNMLSFQAPEHRPLDQMATGTLEHIINQIITF